MTNTMAVEEYFKPICHGSPRPLLELASMKMASNIWLQRFNEFYEPGNNLLIKITDLEFNVEISTAIPQKIQNMIDTQIYPIAKELHKWVVHVKSVLKNLSYDQIYTRLNLVSFGGNGTVHFKDTISNFIEDDSLDNKTRFEIACVNCVEEKINLFWPLLSHTLNLDNLQFDNDFMLYYWICRKEGQLDRIPLDGFDSIERLMIQKCCENFSFLAVEYFFTLLNPDNKLVVLGELLEPNVDEDEGERIFLDDGLFRMGEMESFVRIFPNIEGVMQSQILDRHTARVLYAFVTCLRPIEYSIQCFLYVRNIITPECYRHEVIMKIINYANIFLQHQRDRRDRGLSEKEEGFWHAQIEIALEQIWLNTPPHLKNYAVENLFSILEAYSQYDCYSLKGFNRNIQFLLSALSNANAELRYRIWNKNWRYWIYGAPPSHFEELMGLCLMNPENIEGFKKMLYYTEDFQHYSSSLIDSGYFTELDEFLNTLYLNPDLVLNIKKHILSTETEIFYRKREPIERYLRYIDNLFSDNSLASDFKRRIILSLPVLEALLILGISSYYDRDDFCSVELIVSLFVPPQNHAEVKNKFLELLHDQIIDGSFCTFDETRLNQFLSWCTENNEQRMDDFMESFQIDDVFEITFYKCLRNGRGIREFENFTSLEIFLLWYFESKGMAENYVRETIEYYEEMDATAVERIFSRDKEAVIDLIKSQLLEKYTS